MKVLFSYILFCLIFITNVNAQNFEEYGIPFVKNYTDKDFLGSSQQNWAVVSDNRGVIYFGNNFGVLEYDGYNSNIIEIANQTNVRSLAVDKKGVVYVGAQADFGYLKADDKGRLKYVSLSGLLKEEEKEFEDVWKTYATSQGVFFQSYKRLFRYKDGKIKSWAVNPTFHFSFVVNDTLYIRQRERGFLKLVGDELEPWKGTSQFASPRTNFVLSYDKGKKLFGTITNGLYIGYYDKAVDSMIVKPFPTEIDEELFQTELYQGIKIGEDKFLLGTLTSGAFLIDKNGKLITKFNKSTGILDNKIFYMAEVNNSIWFATNKGISHVEINSPLTRFDDRLGLGGKLYSTVRIQDKLFCATSQGIYYSYKNNNHIEFKLLKGSSFQCWDILALDDKNFLVGFGNGLLKINISNIDEPEMEQLTQSQCFTLYRSPFNASVVYSGNGDGLQKITLKGNKVENIEDVLPDEIQSEIKSIGENTQGEIWLATSHEGIYKVRDKNNKYEFAYFDTTNGLPSNLGNQVFLMKSKLFFITISGIYNYNADSKKQFQKNSELTSMISGTPDQILKVNLDAGGNYFVQLIDIADQKNGDDKGIAFKAGNGKFKWDPVPLRRIPRSPIYAMLSEANGITWLGNSDGLYRYDANFNKNYRAPFNVLIRNVFVSKDTIVDDKAAVKKDVLFMGTFFSKLGDFTITESNQSENFVPKINFESNTIHIEFSAPFFEEEDEIEYQFYLEGLEETWSEWTATPFKAYPKLNNGKYTFKLRARNVYGTESKITEYKFTILPPWYKTYWAYAAYVLLIIAAIYGIVQASVYRLKAAKDRLERIVKERTAEVVKQKDEIENKNEELNQQNEEISAQRDEIENQKHLLEHKNKEVTDSIFYAKKIQDAILVSPDVISKAIPNSFILFKPKDIVSGDFYFYSKINRDEKSLHVLGSADCTGHGVPGAFMSMIGNDKLNEAAKVFSDPGHILQHLNNLIKDALQKADNANSAKDGMDIALCVIDPVHRKLKYAAANRPLWIIKNGSTELEEIKATKTAIGGFTDYDQVYDSHELQFEEGDTVYFFTDGYADQFGGELGKKMMTKKFKEKLFEIKELSLPEQKEILDQFYMDWKEGYEQVDDVLVIGVRF